MAMSLDDGILMVLSSVCGKYGKNYCYPSQAHILRLLERIYLIQVSRRTLNRHLKKLEGLYFFERIRRHIKGPGEKAVFRSTMYKLRCSMFNLAKTFEKWLKRICCLRRVPHVAQYSSVKQGRDLIGVFADCGNPVEILLKGMTSPSPLRR